MTKTLELYCPVCKKHTPHIQYSDMYATGCSVCHTQTSQLERVHTENLSFNAPDGTAAKVVHNTPDTVTFFVSTGAHAGYYHFNKHTKEKSIVAIKPELKTNAI